MFQFSLLHSSARPEKWREIYQEWLDKADDPSQVEYILVGDQRWGFHARHLNTDIMGMREQDVCLNLFPARRCYVEGVNLAARHSHGRTLIVIADDQHPCQGWDTHINRVITEHELRDRGSELEFAIRVPTGTPDEIKRNITVMPILSRSRYLRLGYVLFPGYESMYADNDFTEHAQMDGVFVEADTLPEFPHRHPFWTDAKMDSQYEAQNRKEAYLIGANIHSLRRATKFGTADPSTVQNPAQKHLALCLPGERFEAEWVSYLIEYFSQLLPRFALYPIFAYCSNVHITRGVIAKQIRELTKGGIKLDYILWVDDDNSVSWAHIERLLVSLDTYSDIDAVCGWCWIQNKAEENFVTSCGFLDDKGLCSHVPESLFESSSGDLIKIDFTGFPLVLMRPHVLELGEHPFAPLLNSHHPWGALSEDTSFWQRAKDQGLRLFVDRNCHVPHTKSQHVGPAARTYNTSLSAAEIPNPVSM